MTKSELEFKLSEMHHEYLNAMKAYRVLKDAHDLIMTVEKHNNTLTVAGDISCNAVSRSGIMMGYHLEAYTRTKEISEKRLKEYNIETVEPVSDKEYLEDDIIFFKHPFVI